MLDHLAGDAAALADFFVEASAGALDPCAGRFIQAEEAEALCAMAAEVMSKV